MASGLEDLPLEDVAQRMGQAQPGSYGHTQASSEMLRRQMLTMMESARYTKYAAVSAAVAAAVAVVAVLVTVFK